MGLDSRIEFIGKVSEDRIGLYAGKNVRDIPLIGVRAEDINNKRYACIRHKAVCFPVIETEINWEMLKDELGVPQDSILYGIGPHMVCFGKDYDHKTEYQCNPYSEIYQHEINSLCYFWDVQTLYEWRRTDGQERIRQLFNREFPEVLDEHTGQREMVYAKYYPLTKNLLKKMYSLDPDFANTYSGEIDNCFYSADW